MSLPCYDEGAGSNLRPKETPMLKSTDIGYVNPNGITVIAKTDQPGSDHNQKVYVLKHYGPCGYIFGANGSDNHHRKCPEDQGGRPGEPLTGFYPPTRR